jgi:hypothetical protein
VQLSKTLIQFLSDPVANGKADTLFEHPAHFVIRKGLTLTMIPLAPDATAMFSITLPCVVDNDRNRYYSMAIHAAAGSPEVHPYFLYLYMTPIMKTEPSIDALFIPQG